VARGRRHVYFKRPGAAVLSALEMVQDGDYFGRTVNLAARIAGHADADQVLVTDEVVAAAGSDGIRFQTLGPVWLKGFSRPVRLHRALPA
jgi:adenylate cyclase